MIEKDRSRLALRKYVAQAPNRSEKMLLETLSKAKFKRGINDENEKFTFFWRSSSYFSQWYSSPFSGKGIIWDDESFLENLPMELTFNCAEQYMMYHKAILFLDRECALNILKAKMPKEQKRLGKLVRNFDEQVWKYYRTSIVYWGNEMKFTQNEKLLEALKRTEGTTLVEASPFDTIWGVGLSAHDKRIRHRSTWKGLNLLGEILTTLRVNLNNGNY